MNVEDLFAVQDGDTEIEQIHRRLSNLSERLLADKVRTERAAVERERDSRRLERLELDRRQKRAEADVEAVSVRIGELEARLYGSGISSPREAREIQVEAERLKPRQDELEERLLEVLEEIDPVDVLLTELDEQANAQDMNLDVAEEALRVAESELSLALEEVQERRHRAASKLSTELLARYEGLRRLFGASTVVRFHGKDCDGCPYSMPAVEVDRMKRLPEHTLDECSECGRMVVR